MAIKFDTFKTSTAGASDVTSVNGEQGDVFVTLDSATDQGATTTNSITVGGLSVGTAYSLPSADGSSGQAIVSDGAGNLSFTTIDPTGALEYKGSFNATAGTPSLANAEQGDYYKIDTAGTIYGQDWAVGDSLLINADMSGTITNSKIDKIDNTDTPASEDVAGVIEIATNAEATAGTATDKALVPSNISSIALSSFNDDLSYLSSGDNVSELTNDAGYLTSVASASETAEGIIEIATNAEATAGTATDKALVPSNISSIALSSFNDDLSYLSSGDNVSVLTNDANYVASGDNVSVLTNDANYVASGDNVSSLTNDAGYITDITAEGLNDLSDVSFTAGVGIDGHVLTYDNTASQWQAVAPASGGLSSVVQDTTPQLGGALDVNGQEITSASNGNVVINPDGTGEITIGADVVPDADATHTIGSEDNRYITTFSDLNGAIRFKAKNDEGAQITKGQAVYIKGLAGDGTTPTVGLADANDASKMPAFGLAFNTASNSAEVQVVQVGNLTGLNTSGFSVGDTLYIDTTAGALVNTKPTGETSQLQNIGRVIRADNADGVIMVGGAGRSAATPNLDQNKIFLGNASNQSVSTALSSIALSSFNDDLNYISSGDNVSVLTNDSGYITDITGENLGDLSDVTITASTTGEYIRYNGSAWVDSALNIIDDTTPQLGGNLDTNSNEIVTASNANLVLRPNGTGHVFLGGNTNPAELRLYCESADAHYVGFKSPTHAQLSGSQVWRLPLADATTGGDALVSDGAGNLSFTTISSGGYTFSAISSATTAQISYHYSCDTSSVAFTLTLPALSGVTAGQEIRVKLATAGNDLTIARTGSDTIDGLTSFTLSTAKSSITLVANTSNTDWEIV